MPQATATTDHGKIKQWVESRKGHPALVKSTEGRRGGGGLLRIDFDPPEQSLDPISWDEFFEIFDENQLAFLYQDRTDSGRKSRFNKFVSRGSIEVESRSGNGNGKHNSRSAAGGEDEDELEEEEAEEDDEDLDDEDFEEEEDDEDEEDEEEEADEDEDDSRKGRRS